MTSHPLWWQSAVVYQIYPWSFQDSNGDGIGDLPGILSRLDYLNDGTPDSLGIDAIWLSPIYPSPMKDFGYDVADYCNVDPRFGTLEDFDRLAREADRRGIRIIMDLVLNHTSDQHPWFQKARSSRSALERDWYYWADGRSFGRPPSNWNARFGGSSWTWDPGSRQYYLHSFLSHQPDLNWRNPVLRAKMHDVIRFWIRRGVQGFRLDAINWLGKDVRWPNNPVRFGWRGYTRQVHCYDRDQPLAHEVMRELRALVADVPGMVLIGEASADTPGGPAAFYGNGRDELHTVFDFRLLKSPWRRDRFQDVISDADRTVPAAGWPSIVFSNHDQSRHIDRYGAGGDAGRRARAAAVLLFTLRGTPFVYYGEEIGMRNGRLRYRDLRDPYTKRFWPFRTGRDPARTPMQWDGSPQAGFTTGRPWLPVSRNAATENVERESKDPSSLLALYRRLLRLRKITPALADGTYRALETGDPDCLAFVRTIAADSTADGAPDVLVGVNFAARHVSCTVSEVQRNGDVLLSTYDETESRSGWMCGRLELRPDEAIIVALV
ncbi:MAG: alpha-glucosidase [Nitrospiraceae bacterium]|nr:alpha-glucosidase [Nitrospiraceae bacterium]